MKRADPFQYALALGIMLAVLLLLIPSIDAAEEADSAQAYLEAYRAEVRKRPKDLQRHRLLIAQAERDQQLQAPLTIYEGSYRRNPNHPVVLYVLGYTLLVQGTPDSLARAESLLRHAIEVAPELVDAHTALGIVLLKREHPEEGVQHLQRAIDLDPKFHQALLALARHYQTEHNYPQAVIYYRRALERDRRSAKVHLELARVLMALQDYPGAIAEAEEAIRSAKTGDAYYLLGQLYALNGQRDKAVAAYRRGRKYAPNDTEARYRLAQIFLDQDNGRYAVLSVRSALAADPAYRDVADRLKGVGIAEAAEQIEQILAEQPGNAGLQLFLGKLRRKFGDTQSAQQHLERARDLEPENSAVRAELAQVYDSQNREELAAQEYQEAVKLGSTEEVPLKRLAESQLAEGTPDAFLDTAKRLFAINPNYPELQSAAGDVYLTRYEQAKQKGDPLLADKYVALALDHYDMASKSDPNNAVYKLKLANLYASRGELKALSVYEDAIALDPGNAQIYYSRARFMLQYRFGAERALLYTLEDVREDLQKAIQLDPDDADVYSALGLAYERANQEKEAAQAYQQALERNPEDLQAHSFLAHWYRNQEEYLKAIYSFRKLAEANPKDVNALRGFALLTLTHNEAAGWREAQKALAQALELLPKDAELLMNYGYTFYLGKQYSEAIRYYRRSLESDPSSALTHFNLALAYELQGQKRLAREEWQQVIDLDDEGRYIDAAVERLAALGGK